MDRRRTVSLDERESGAALWQMYSGRSNQNIVGTSVGFAEKPSPREEDSPRNQTLLERSHRLEGHPERFFEKAHDPLPKTAPGALETAQEEQSQSQDRVQEEMGGGPDPTYRPSREAPQQDTSSADLRRFRDFESEAEEHFHQYRTEKMRSALKREEEKRKDLSMLQTYNPWGRPGGGAPAYKYGDEFRKKPFLEEDLEKRGVLQEGDNTRRLKAEFGDFRSYFGRPGHGAPLRTDSGGVRAQLKGDAAIRFQDSPRGKFIAEKEVRYKQTEGQKQEYSQELDRQLQEKDLKAEEERIQELRREIDFLKYDPFGKPGAGAPNRSKSGSKLVTPRAQTLTHSVEEMRRRERKKLQDSNAFTNPQQQRSTEARHEVIKDLFPAEKEKYDPWGKGAGAPRRDSHGNVARHPVSKPGIGVHTSSAPPAQTTVPNWKEERASHFRTDLEREAEERSRLNLINRTREARPDQQHLETLDTLYGPGNGAPPLERGNRRPKVEGLLYTRRREAPEQLNTDRFYVGAFSRKEEPRFYGRGANHKNRFELSSAQRLQSYAKNYKLPVPYATQEEPSLDKLLRLTKA